jgi:hypothetical protein
MRHRPRPSPTQPNGYTMGRLAPTISHPLRNMPDPRKHFGCLAKGISHWLGAQAEKNPARWPGEVGSKDRWTGIKLQEALARVPKPVRRWSASFSGTLPSSAASASSHKARSLRSPALAVSMMRFAKRSRVEPAWSSRYESLMTSVMRTIEIQGVCRPLSVRLLPHHGSGRRTAFKAAGDGRDRAFAHRE